MRWKKFLSIAMLFSAFLLVSCSNNNSASNTQSKRSDNSEKTYKYSDLTQKQKLALIAQEALNISPHDRDDIYYFNNQDQYILQNHQRDETVIFQIKNDKVLFSKDSPRFSDRTRSLNRMIQKHFVNTRQHETTNQLTKQLKQDKSLQQKLQPASSSTREDT